MACSKVYCDFSLSDQQVTPPSRGRNFETVGVDVLPEGEFKISVNQRIASRAQRQWLNEYEYFRFDPQGSIVSGDVAKDTAWYQRQGRVGVRDTS